MANKTYLVARREFMENMRTKAFWIGILMFPVIWIAALTLPALFQKAKSVRNYAVLDQSKDGWFMKEIDRRSRRPNLVKLLKGWRDADEEERGRLPETIGNDLWKPLRDADNRTRAGLVAFIRTWSDPRMASLRDKVAKDMAALSADEWQKQFETGLAFVRKMLGNAGGKLDAVKPELSEFLRSYLSEPAPFRASEQAMVDWWEGLANSADKEDQALAAEYQPEAGLGMYSRVDAPADEAAIQADLKAGKLFAYFVVPADPVGKAPKRGPAIPPGGDGDGGKKAVDDTADVFKYVTNKENLADRDLKEWFTKQANRIVRERRIESIRLDPKRASWISQSISFSEKQLDEEGKEKKVEKKDKFLQYAPIVFVYLLWICVFTIANILLTNTIEEKSNKVIEVLLSSVSPLQLMRGKILGLAWMGLTMVGFWALFAWLGIKLVPLFIENSAGVIAEFGIDRILTNPRYIVSFLVYFLGGYLLYAAMLVGIGAVCNSLKEAQNLMQPVVIVLIVPLLAMFPIVQDPNGMLAKIMTYIPVFTPFVMMNRAAGPPTMLEYAISTILMIATVWFVMYLAAKVFRIGILMTGKPPKIREIIGWMKAPVGSVPVRRDDVQQT